MSNIERKQLMIFKTCRNVFLGMQSMCWWSFPQKYATLRNVDDVISG